MKILDIYETLFINESQILNGVILIKGKVLEDKSQRLYAIYCSYINRYDRTKKDDTKGSDVKMVQFNKNSNVYRLKLIDGKLKPVGISFTSNESMLSNLAISGNSIALNNNKTPLHWESLKYDNINTVLNKVGNQLLSLPNINWNS